MEGDRKNELWRDEGKYALIAIAIGMFIDPTTRYFLNEYGYFGYILYIILIVAATYVIRKIVLKIKP